MDDAVSAGRELEMLRREKVGRFVRRTFGLRGTLGLHRAALGGDLLRAPLNVALAPVFLVVRLLAVAARLVRAHGVADWLASRRVLLRTEVTRRLEQDIRALLSDLERAGVGVAAPPGAVERAIGDYVGVRSAVAEIVTAVVVIGAGLALFHTPTPGVVWLAGPLSEAVARATAIAEFPLGQRLGGVWYRMFPVELPVSFVLATGLMLALLGRSSPRSRASSPTRCRRVWASTGGACAGCSALSTASTRSRFRLPANTSSRASPTSAMSSSRSFAPCAPEKSRSPSQSRGRRGAVPGRSAEAAPCRSGQDLEQRDERLAETC